MPGTDFYRAIATAKFLQDELIHERDAHDAMKLCFEKIHKSLELYKGHYINRLRFHLNRHHTEYLRKVRAMRKEKMERKPRSQEKPAEQESEPVPDNAPASPASSPARRRSMRVGIAQDLASEVERLKAVIRRKDLEIERLAMLLDESTPSAYQTVVVIGRAGTDATAVEEGSGERPRAKEAATPSIRRLMNPYLPSSSSSSDNDDSGDEGTPNA
jgi:hypothetical protein